MSGDVVVKYLADRIAMVLKQHLALVRGIKARLDESTRTSPEFLAESLESLRGLRARIREDLDNVAARMHAADNDDLMDFYALISFFIEVSYPGEKKALEAMSPFIDVGGDLASLEGVYARALSVRSAVEKAMRGGGPG
ncbi:hypothetical protein [Stetteria hydrogenophila]